MQTIACNEVATGILCGYVNIRLGEFEKGILRVRFESKKNEQVYENNLLIFTVKILLC